jgi:hypothetical protein
MSSIDGEASKKAVSTPWIDWVLEGMRRVKAVSCRLHGDSDALPGVCPDSRACMYARVCLRAHARAGVIARARNASALSRMCGRA